MSETLRIPSFGDPKVLSDPFPVYDLLRERTPVYRSEELGVVLITRYDDIMTVVRDPETFSTGYFAARTSGANHSPAVAAVLAEGYPGTDVLAQADGDRHEYHASLVKPYLTPSRVRSMGTRIQQVVDDLADRLSPGETHDVVRNFAAPLTIVVMCDFVGVPREDHEIFTRGGDAEVCLLGGVLEEDVAIRYAREFVALQNYLADRIRERQAQPRDDLISYAVNTPPPDGLEPLTMAEMVRLIKQIVIAGNETTRGLISSALLRLARDPDLRTRVQASEEGLEHFIEETLRADPPVLNLFRVATRDTELRGVPIHAGDTLAVVWGAGNYDPEMFACPHQFDIERDNVRRHLAFGFGTHYCMGAPMARLEAKIALRALLGRFPTIEFAPAFQPRYVPAFMVHNLERLPLLLA